MADGFTHPTGLPGEAQAKASISCGRMKLRRKKEEPPTRLQRVCERRREIALGVSALVAAIIGGRVWRRRKRSPGEGVSEPGEPESVTVVSADDLAGDSQPPADEG